MWGDYKKYFSNKSSEISKISYIYQNVDPGSSKITKQRKTITTKKIYRLQNTKDKG